MDKHLKLVDDTVKNLSTGEDVPVQVATCGGCGHGTFLIFQVKGQEHPHFQCVVCGETYCTADCQMNEGVN